MSRIRLSAILVLVASSAPAAMAQDASPLEMLGSAWFDGVRKADHWQAQPSPEASQPVQRSGSASSNCTPDWHAGLTSASSNGSCDGKAVGRRDLAR